MGKASFILLIFFCFLVNSYSQDIAHPPLRFMFYNVQNFFDTYDDTLTEDNEFLPNGVMRWNKSRYKAKINSLYKTIIAAGTWDPPEMVAFCEIEHAKILEELIYGTYLLKYDYGIIHEESPDRRGIDVCMIYRKNSIRIFSYNYIYPSSVANEFYSSRSTLYVRIGSGNDTIHLFVNHWPSRRGGVLAGESVRSAIASTVKGYVDSLGKSNKNAKIIIAGDFNCTPDDKLIQDFYYDKNREKCIINLADSLSNSGAGTYRYMGMWELIDQILVSRNLVNCSNGYYTSGKHFHICNMEFLLTKDNRYPGNSPYPTYRGYKYAGGYSDHLPVVLDLIFR
jgi:hypothetical protein